MASGHVNRTNRPNTWLHRPACGREESPCQPGAVHTWHFASDERCAQDVRFLGKCGLAADAKSTRLTRLGRWTEWGSAPQHLYFRTIQVCPKDRLTLPPAGWRCGKPTRLARPLAGL